MANYGYKLMANPNPYSKRITCSAYGCDMKCGTNTFSEIKMFTFPRDPFRRRRWELATRRANWKSHSRSRICSKHFVTGRPSKDPTHPDYIPSIFVFNKNAQNSKSSSQKKTRKKILATESCTNPACENSFSDAGTFVPSSCGVKGFCNRCFSSESVSSAFSQSLEPLNQTLAQMMLKLTDMEEEREQLRNELALCRGEIHQLRESHQRCMTNPPSTSRSSTHSKPISSVSFRSSTSVDETEVLDSSFSDEPADVYDSDVLPSQYLEQIYHQPDKASKGKRRLKKKLSKGIYSDDMISILDQSPKKRMKSSSLESKSISKSARDGKSSDTGSPITIVYLKR